MKIMKKIWSEFFLQKGTLIKKRGGVPHGKSRKFCPEFTRGIAPALLESDRGDDIGRRLRREGVGEGLPPSRHRGGNFGKLGKNLEREKNLVFVVILFIFLNKVPKST